MPHANMSCTEFCMCGGGSGCFNQKMKEHFQAEDAESKNDDDDDGTNDIKFVQTGIRYISAHHCITVTLQCLYHLL